MNHHNIIPPLPVIIYRPNPKNPIFVLVFLLFFLVKSSCCMIHIRMSRCFVTTIVFLLYGCCIITIAQAQICFILYSMADNNLEAALRNDLKQYISSPAIKDETVTSWIYFDGRNLNNTWEDIEEPLEDVYCSDGTPMTEKMEGSVYLKYNHNVSKLMVDTILEEEQNSDNPQTVIQFLTHAITDCIASGSVEYMLIFSSHGGGWYGFGGDEWERRKSRYLKSDEKPQTNQELVNAINASFQAVSGAPSKVNVLAFDACLMSELGSLDEYRDIADYVVVSEAVVPGHGFAYNKLETTDSAVAMAQDLLDSFITEKQPPIWFLGWVFGHQVPKTLSIINTTGYSTFLTEWEIVFTEMKHLFDTYNDPSFVSIIARSRSGTQSFGGVDGLDRLSMMDIGLFFVSFEQLCNIDPESQLRTLINNAQKAYDSMYVARGVGEGTPNSTGCSVFWPEQKDYFNMKDFYDNVLFNSSTPYATVDAPNWLAFLKAFYTPTNNTSESSTNPVCLNRINSNINATYEGQLLLNPDVENVANDDGTWGVLVTSEIALETDYVSVTYGMNVTHFLEERRLREKIHRHLNKRKQEPLNQRGSQNKLFSLHGRRRIEEDDDHYYIYGGNVKVKFDQANFNANWDRNVFYLDFGNEEYEGIFAIDEGNGQKSFPICYFPPDSTITSADLEIYPNKAMAIEDLGCIEGSIVFSVSQGLNSSFLYILEEEHGTYSELPATVGGKISPIVYVSLYVDGGYLEEIVGGFMHTIFDWGVDNRVPISQARDDVVLNYFEAKIGLIETGAFDFDIFDYETLLGYDYYLYPYSIVGSSENSTIAGSPVTNSTPPEETSQASSAIFDCTNFSCVAILFVFTTHMLQIFW